MVSARAGTISGFVRDAEDGEALPYANVSLQGTSYGAIANQQGYYIIASIPVGSYQLVISYIGYRAETRGLDLVEDQDLAISVELDRLAVELETIEVEAGGSDLIVEPSKVSLRTRDLIKPAPVAEVDLFRSVQALPGVSTLSDFSSGLYVRGGSADQNLILLDDVDVYNPSHLFGFFSTFNVDAVKTVDLQKGGFPAKYGGRLSSLLDVHNRDGNRKEHAGVARASLISASATLEGPWRGGSWMLSGRHTYLEQLAKTADIDLPYRFYDLHGRVNYDPGNNDRTSLSYYQGRDILDWDRAGLDVVLDWGNEAWSAQWTHLFHSRLFSHFLIGHSRFDSRVTVAFRDLEFRMHNQIDDLALKGNLSYVPSSPHMIDFGFEGKFLDFSFDREIGEEDRLSFSYDGIYGAVYGQENWKLSEQWQLQAGIRLGYYSEGSYLKPEPRLSIRRRFDDDTSVHLTYGRYHQYLNLVSQEGASFADMWFPVDRTLSPGTADHFIVGFEARPADNLDLSIEAYYKPYSNVVEFSEEFTRSLVEEDARLDELFNSGKGTAYGLDGFLRNHVAGFDGWLGYSFGVTKRTIRDYNFGSEYYPNYDRRHQIVVMQDRTFGRNWRANISFRYGSGQPTTRAVARYTVRDITGREYDTYLEGEKNAARLPAYHRLDVGFSYRFDYDTWFFEPSLQIINVYNQENVYIRTYDLTTSPPKTEDITMLPFLPTVGIRVVF